MRRAIVGSRDYRGGIVNRFVRDLPDDTIIVSGGAGGPDTEAEMAARMFLPLPPEIIRAEWSLYGRAAGKRRNWPLVNRAEEVDAFWDGWSNGTAHAVAAAVALGRPVRVQLPYDFPLAELLA